MKRLEESLRTAEAKVKAKEQMCQSLCEKVHYSSFSSTHEASKDGQACFRTRRDWIGELLLLIRKFHFGLLCGAQSVFPQRLLDTEIIMEGRENSNLHFVLPII